MNIVILDANTMGRDLDLTIYDELGHVTVYGFTEQDQVIDRIRDAHVIICNKNHLDETNLPYAKNLQLICLTATGSNNVDKVYTNAKGIVVSNVMGYSTPSVAQHTFAMLFYLYEKMRYYDNYIREGLYVGDDQFIHYQTTFHELDQKTWGIIGLGAIGRKVADLAKAFGCKVIYYSTSGKNSNPDYHKVDLKTLLRESDVISIHAPLNADTDYLLSYKEFKMMKKEAVLLNLGRGRIINEGDLAKALDDGLLGAAGIDVLEYEPMIGNHPFLSVKEPDRLLVTPHIGWASIESRNRVLHEVKENIISFTHGKPRNQVTS